MHLMKPTCRILLLVLSLFGSYLKVFAESRFSTEDLDVRTIWYSSETDILATQDLQEIITSGKFRQVSTLDYLTDPNSWDHWLILETVSQSDLEENYVFDFEKWVEVKISEIGNTSSNTYITGHHIPYVDRNYPSANDNLIAITYQPGERKTLLVELHSTIDFLQIPTNVVFDVSKEETVIRNRLSRRLAFGMFIGFYLIMLLYNLFIYASTRNRNYLPYLVSLVGTLLVTIHIFGFLVPILRGFKDYVFFHSEMQFITSMILGWSMLWFTAWFLDVRNRYPTLFLIMKILAVLIVFLPLPALLGYASINEQFSGMLGILTMIFILTVAIKSVRDDYPSSGLFLIGYGAFSLGIIVMLCTFLGILPLGVQDWYPVNIGSTIEMVFFSLALGNRINELARENEEKQAQIIEQLREKDELQTKLNLELEEKVIARTAEIESQKVEIEKEKENADALLLNILPAPIARELRTKGFATPRYYPMASVLFADMVSFTKKSEGLRPERVINELDFCFKGFDDILDRYNIEKIKTIGDGYFCVGGVPIPFDESAVNTVKVGLEMQEFIEKWGEDKKEWNEEPWQIRIGIHTGEVVAGIVGKNKFAYDVWGATVNTASRVESSCAPGRVTISEDTYQVVKDYFEVEYRREVQTKEREIGMYYVLGLK